MKKEITLSFEEIEEKYKKAKLERFKKAILIKVTSPAKDILSGKAFSKLFKTED